MIPKAQEIYKHFKGNLYQIITLAEHTESGETLVVYQAMYGEFKIYARPLTMFCSKVDKEKYPQSKQEYRFERQMTRGENDSLTHTASTAKKVELEEMVANELPIPEVKETLREDVQAWKADICEEVTAQEAQLDPMLLAFLDAETYVEKINILAGMHHRITDEMITTMAIASDVEIGEGDLEDRYNQLKNCLLTLDKYEINRLR